MKSPDASSTGAVPVTGTPTPAIPVRVTEETGPAEPEAILDQRQARIDALTAELEYRRNICQIIEKFKHYDNFVASTLKLEGQIAGLQESLRLAPPAAPVAPAASESEATN